MIISRDVIVAELRARGKAARADWVERTLPEQVDTDRHTGIFATLGLDPKALATSSPA